MTNVQSGNDQRMRQTPMTKTESRFARLPPLGPGYWSLCIHWSLRHRSLVLPPSHFSSKVARSLLCPIPWASAAFALSSLVELKTYASQNGSKSSCLAARIGRHRGPFCFILPFTARRLHPNGRFLSARQIAQLPAAHPEYPRSDALGPVLHADCGIVRRT